MADSQANFSNITIADGLKGYYAAPVRANAPGVIVVMEIFGLTKHIAKVCDELAAAGFAALAPDLYHGETFGYSEIDRALPKLKSMNDDAVVGDMAKSLDFLSAQSGVDASRLGVFGFCMGGRYAFLAACRLASKIKATVAFYGGGIGPEGESDPLGRKGLLPEAGAINSPMLLVYGGKDSSIPAAEHARIVQSLSEKGKQYRLSLYPEGGHGFCCEERASYHAASAALSMQEALEFLELHLAA